MKTLLSTALISATLSLPALAHTTTDDDAQTNSIHSQHHNGSENSGQMMDMSNMMGMMANMPEEMMEQMQTMMKDGTCLKMMEAMTAQES